MLEATQEMEWSAEARNEYPEVFGSLRAMLSQYKRVSVLLVRFVLSTQFPLGYTFSSSGVWALLVFNRAYFTLSSLSVSFCVLIPLCALYCYSPLFSYVLCRFSRSNVYCACIVFVVFCLL